MQKISDQEIKETITHLQNLVRINTTNPPGNEILACDYLKSVFVKLNIPYQILESAPGRGNIIARIKGNGNKKPLLLTSHLDVVPAEKEYWDEDPFSGTIKDGFIWGRGTVDMKNMTAMLLTVFLKAFQNSENLKRDLIFAAVADEEAGCEYGSKWLVDNHPELIQAEYALNEVGGFSLTVEDKVFYPIGVAEKGMCWFKIKAKGDPGHGAMPHDNQAVGHVCFAAHKLSENNLPYHKTKVVENFVSTLANKQTLAKKLILKSLLKKPLANFVLKKVFPDKAKAQNFYNMFRNLATPTILKAGQKENVIPSVAEVTVDGRILPEHTVKSFLAEIQDLIGPRFEIEVLRSNDPVETEYQNDFFKTLKETIKKHDPEAIPVPFLIPGFTDAKEYHRLGIKTYGYTPVKLPADLNFGALYHGHNERIPVDAIGFGVKVLWDVILKSCY